MKFLNYEYFCYNHEPEFENIAVFKRVAITPANKDFLSSKVTTKNYCIMSIHTGQFEWNLNGKKVKIKPHDLVIVSPGVDMEKEFDNVEFGAFYKLSLDAEFYRNELDQLAQYSFLKECERNEILNHYNSSKIIILKNHTHSFKLFTKLTEEFIDREMGYSSRIKSLIDEILICGYRDSVNEKTKAFDSSKEFQELNALLKANLSHQWTVKEMAEFSGMGVTKFTEKLKKESGYSPFDYLIFLRVNEAANLIKYTDQTLTEIALETGFYSSQHFSSTFKKYTGYSPREFRKNEVA